jgi:hypothetical protein
MDYRSKKESLQMTIFWVLVWGAIIGISYWPDLIGKLIAVSGGKSGLGSVFGMAIVFLMFVTYRVYVKANRVEKQVNYLIRILILKDIKKRK